MANSIAFVRSYTSVIDEVYQRAAVSGCLNSPRRMARAGRNAREIMVPKIEVTGLGDYTRNVGYKTGSITYEFETKTFNYDRGIRLLADVMDVEEAGVLDCFVEAGSELQRVQVAPEADAFTFAEIAGHEGVESSEMDYSDAEAEDILADVMDVEEAGVLDCFVAAGSELQRTQVAPEADAFTFSEIAGHEGVNPVEEDFSDADAEDVLASLRAATNEMDEAEVTTGSRILFITPTLKGVLDDFSLANPTRSNRVLERFSRIVEVPQTQFFSAIALNSGEEDQFGYARAEGSYQLTENTSVVTGKPFYTKRSEQYTPVSSPASGSLSSYYKLVPCEGLPLITSGACEDKELRAFLARTRALDVTVESLLLMSFSRDGALSHDDLAFILRAAEGHLFRCAAFDVTTNSRASSSRLRLRDLRLCGRTAGHP